MNDSIRWRLQIPRFRQARDPLARQRRALLVDAIFTQPAPAQVQRLPSTLTSITGATGSIRVDQCAENMPTARHPLSQPPRFRSCERKTSRSTHFYSLTLDDVTVLG
jgi:hypothetical protein